MGIIRLPPPVQLFCALLVAPSVTLDDIEATLAQHYGNIILHSPAIPFTQTSYYEHEMGAGLTRLYVAFDSLINIADLAAVKHTTNHLETLWGTQTKQRRVNLDPGYLDLAKVVLATTKDHGHRVYIGAGIFAEVTLRYRHKNFHPWEWTYKDYKIPETLAFFHQLRDLYKAYLYKSYANRR